jgi:uncharacterized lipoprotein YbaY
MPASSSRRVLWVILAGFIFTLLPRITFAQATLPVRQATLRGGQPELWEATATYPVFPGRSVMARTASAAFRNDARKRFDEFSRFARTNTQSKKPVGLYSFKLTPVMGIATPALVSGYLAEESYTGGAHGNAFFYPRTIGVINRRVQVLTLKDLLSPVARPYDLLTRAVLPALNAQKKARGAGPIAVLDGKLVESFMVTPTGITWLFAPYSAGPYSEGGYIVKIPFTALRPWLNPNGPLKPLLLGGGTVQPSSTVTLVGTVTYRERIALDPKATLELRLSNTPTGAPGAVFVKKAMPAKNPPIPFTLEFDTRITPNVPMYYLQVDILLEGKRLFRNPELIPVPRTGWTAPREILVRRG